MRYKGSTSNFYKWRDKFIESGKKYSMNQADQEIIETVNNLRNKLSVLKIFKIAKIPRSYIYHKRKNKGYPKIINRVILKDREIE